METQRLADQLRVALEALRMVVEAQHNMDNPYVVARDALKEIEGLNATDPA